MIYFNYLLAAALAASVYAAPQGNEKVPQGSKIIQSEANGYNLLTVCNNINFKGNCVTWVGKLNKCYGMAEYNDAVSSAKVYGGIYCRLYKNAGCKSPGPLITGPAYNLKDQNFNDKASSYYCYLD